MVLFSTNRLSDCLLSYVLYSIIKSNAKKRSHVIYHMIWSNTIGSRMKSKRKMLDDEQNTLEAYFIKKNVVLEKKVCRPN
jgi:hypothetical protein